MNALNRLCGQREMSRENYNAKGGRMRALARFGAFGVGLAFIALMFITSPPSGYAAFPGTNGKIVFGSNRDDVYGAGYYDIYVMNADGTGQTRLTNNAASDHAPRWSPDGQRIVFASNRDGNNEIYVMNADGTAQTRLTNNPASDDVPAFSPDGTKITYASDRDGNLEIYVMKADGTGQTRLTNNTADDQSPSFSPDGTKIVFYSNRDGNYEIYVMNADGTGQTRLTNDPALDGEPDWSPDGTKIVFQRDIQVFVMNADGTNVTQLTNSGDVPAWSPDGTKIAFRNGEIYVMNADGTGQTMITNNTSAELELDWGPLPTPAAIEISIDIKPGSFPNSINPKSKGVIPVAILTTNAFDATNVDSASVSFGKTGTEAAPVHVALEDVDGDGDTDMILHFKIQNTGIQCGDTSASLTGQTLSGQPIEGSDSINTVGCK